jgi:phosphoglycerate dehydrogenase-like enzyme
MMVGVTLRCVVLDDYQDAALASADWTRLAGRVEVTVLRHHLADEDEVAEALREFDIAVIMRERTPFPASLLARLPRLRLLITSGMRNAAIDLDAATANGVVVCGTASGSAPPVELTWALILGLVRGLVHENAGLRAGGWGDTVAADLAGRTLGVVGLGKIGARVAAIGSAFEMNVLAWSQNLTTERATAAGATLAGSLADLLDASDVVTVHLKLSDRTRGLLDAAALARLRPDAYLVNTARAAIVDQQALLEALTQNRIAGAGLDVFDVEPLPAGHPFRTLPNVLATPHLGYVSRANYQGYFEGAVANIEAYLAGTPIRTLN